MNNLEKLLFINGIPVDCSTKEIKECCLTRIFDALKIIHNLPLNSLSDVDFLDYAHSFFTEQEWDRLCDLLQ